jgi:hypothetical protein
MHLCSQLQCIPPSKRFPRIVSGTVVTLFYTLQSNIKYNSVRVSQTFRLVYYIRVQYLIFIHA